MVAEQSEHIEINCHQQDPASTSLFNLLMFAHFCQLTARLIILFSSPKLLKFL